MNRTDLLDVLYDRPVEVAHWCGFDKMTDLHNGWLQSFLFSTDDQTLQSHRGSYKTTTLSVFFALHSLIKPNETMLYMRKTDTDVQEIARQTKNILRSGAFQKMALMLYGRPLEITKDAANEIDTSLHDTVSGASQIVGLGIGSSITGKHADIVVTDDIVNIRDRVSHAEREATKRAYMELQNIRNRGGRMINTGTPWHKDDCFTLMPNLTRYDVYQTGLISQQEQAHLRESMTPALYAANYELKHIADEDALFKAPHWCDAEDAALFEGVGHVDAAYGGTDYTAYTAMKEDGDRIYAYGKIWQKHVDDCISEIDATHARFRLGSLYCEDNADKGYLASELEDMGLPVSTYHESTNKYLKISTYLRKNWNRIYWVRDTDPNYITQILDYTENAEHDDAPDSAASLLREMGQDGTISTAGYLRGGW